MTGHSAVYLPDTDEVRFTVDFDRQPIFPGDWLRFLVGFSGPTEPLTTIGGASLRDQGTVEVRYFDNASIGQGQVKGIVPHDVEGMRLNTLVPLEMLHVDSWDFGYAVATDASSASGRSQFAVPEVSAVALAGIGIAAVVFCWAVRRARGATALVIR
jgi:hypothetical protein